MPTFTAKVTHKQLSFSPFSAEQMVDFGRVMIDVIRSRITQGLDVQDRPARALNPGYAKDKVRRNRSPIRDWTYSGRTLGSLAVKSASEDKVTIGFANNFLNRKVTVEQIVTMNNKLVPQWGVSPNDEKAKVALVTKMLQQHRVIVVKVA